MYNFVLFFSRVGLATYVPFYVDLRPETFGILRRLLNEYATSLTNDELARPFHGNRFRKLKFRLIL